MNRTLVIILRIVTIASVVLFIWFLYNRETTPAQPGIIMHGHSHNLPLPEIITADRSNAVPFPAHGTVKTTSNEEPVAIFTINTSSNGNYHYILLKNIEDGSRISIYVLSDTSFSTEVPLGEYEFFYAIGSEWFGDDELFGNNRAFKAEKTLIFSYSDGGMCSEHCTDEHITYHGREVTLQGAIDGNFPTNPVNMNELIESP